MPALNPHHDSCFISKDKNSSESVAIIILKSVRGSDHRESIRVASCDSAEKYDLHLKLNDFVVQCLARVMIKVSSSMEKARDHEHGFNSSASSNTVKEVHIAELTLTIT